MSSSRYAVFVHFVAANLEFALVVLTVNRRLSLISFHEMYNFSETYNWPMQPKRAISIF